MIKLRLESYCNDCPVFEPETQRLIADDEVALTAIYCSNRIRCEKIKNYLEKRIHNIPSNEDRCVCCGEIIPEGRQVCPNCEKE